MKNNVKNIIINIFLIKLGVYFKNIFYKSIISFYENVFMGGKMYTNIHQKFNRNGVKRNVDL